MIWSDRIRELTETRARHPDRIAELWEARHSRSRLPPDGRLLIVAADHPARGVLGVRSNATAMADRIDFLGRLVSALRRPGVDGVLASADILEDLLLLGLLDERLVIGSMNRAGLQGSCFELDDRITGYTPEVIDRFRLDGGKVLVRIDLDDPATAPTLEAAGAAITALAQAGRMAVVETFLSFRGHDGRVTNLLDPESVIRSIHIASGLGATSAHTWLKLPVVEEMTRVLQATTLPTLLLGGDPTDEPERTRASWAEALACPAARGLIVGRALLYPRDGEVAAAVDAAVRLVHGGSR